MCSSCLQNNSIPWMGSKMPLDSSTLAIKSHLNAHALPICTPSSVTPYFSDGKLMYRFASLQPRVPEMSVSISFPVVQNPPSGAHFHRNHYHVMPCSCCLPARGWLHSMLWVAGGSMCERMFVTATAVTALAGTRQMSLA